MNKNECAIVIPVYKIDLDESALYSIRRNFRLLSGRDFHFVCPEKLRADIKKIFPLIGFQPDVTFFNDKFFVSTDSYNKLMLSRMFYRRFEKYKYILIAQDDSLVVSDELSYWCNKSYSYIGAPWFVGFNEPKFPLSFYGVGNGGFSLRKVKDHFRFLSRPRRIIYPKEDTPSWTRKSGLARIIKNFSKKYFFRFNYPFLLPRVNEDVFWGKFVPNTVPWFKVPTAEEALGFAFEVNPADCYLLNNYNLPFGCHAWERYDRKFWERNLEMDEKYDYYG